MNSLPKIFCAIDKADLEAARKLARDMTGACGSIKLGQEFFNAFGPQGVKRVLDDNPGLPLFLDLKYHDIPNTVAAAVREASNALKPAYLNVHASGGLEMMKAAKEVCHPETRLLGVTVLTSLNDAGLAQIGQSGPVQDQVVRLAKLTQQAGLAGVVCSAHEIIAIRQACGRDFVLMVPGIRPAGADVQDQKRVMTPQEAIAAGATHLVIGRPITQAPDPRQAALDILASIQ